MILQGSLQESILALLAYSDQHAYLIRNIVDIALYGGPYRTVAARCYDYIDRFKKPPKDHLPELLSDKIEGKNAVEAEHYGDIISAIRETYQGINPEYIMSKLQHFIRRQSLKGMFIEIAPLLQKETEESLDEAESILSRATRQNLQVFDCGTRLSDRTKALAFLSRRTDTFPTGIAEFDKRGFGPTRRELCLYLANTKSGKCAISGEPVALSDGSFTPIEQFPAGGSVLALTKDFKFEARPATLSFNGIKPAFKLVTRTGRQVSLTDNHPVLTKRGWVEVKDLTTEIEIAVPLEIPIFGVEICDHERLRLLGYLIADGGLTTSNATFHKNDKEMVSDFERCAKPYACELVQAGRAGQYRVVSVPKGNTNRITQLLRETKLMGCKSNAKRIPDFIFRLEKPLVAEFLSALFTCDGSIMARRTGPIFEYSTTSQTLARQVDHLLTRFGIVAKTRERWQTVAGQPYVSWLLSIQGRDQIKLFADEIGLLFGKGRKLQALLTKEYPRKARIGYMHNDRRGQIFWDKVISIMPIGNQPTYDLSVENDHNFVCGNIVVHNSWWLIHLAKQALLHRLRVCHISLEMGADLCAQRYFQTLFAMAKRNDVLPVTKIKLDQLGRITGFDDAKVAPRLSLDDPDIEKKLQAKIDKWGPRVLKNIFIRKFPTRTLTINQLKAYLDNLETTERFVPDVLIVDYPDLFRIDKQDFRLGLGHVYQELRGMADERNLACVVVSQTNREGGNAKWVDLEHMAEHYGKAQDADCVISYNQTEAEHRMGLARLRVIAGRNDEDNIIVVISQQYGLGQFVINSALMVGNYWENVEGSDG